MHPITKYYREMSRDRLVEKEEQKTEGVKWVNWEEPKKDILKEDSILESVLKQFRERSEVGIKKYGVTLDRNDLSLVEWLEHAKQESMDHVLYLEKAIKTLTR